MSYFLGIDLGTTYTAAAVCRDGKAEIARLGSHTPSIPSVVLLREDGEVLTGEAAERRAITEPQRIAREFKRRFGDPTPIIVGGTPYSADALTAKLLGAVVAKVSETEGYPPAGIAVSHPANWGDYKKDLLTQAVRRADLNDVSFITEPEAAAIHYASQERITRGSVIAVYDLGGGTFDAAVLKRTDFGWQILGQPEGVEHLGGVDFDEAVFSHVAGSIGDDFDLLDPDDPAVLSAVARLRHECVEAKEALASDTDVTIPVLLPSTSTQTEVRLTRSEFEQMIRPSIADSITALERALRAAGVTPDDVTSVLLVGGSSRIPLVSEMVGSAVGRPVAIDAHPKHGVALGAAIVADDRGALAALTAAGEAATTAAATMAGFASVRGASGEETALAGRGTGLGTGMGPGLGTGVGPGLGNGLGTGNGLGIGPGTGLGTVAGPPVGTDSSGGTAAAALAPAEDRTTPRELPMVTPDAVPAYGSATGATASTGTGYYGGPVAPPRRNSSGSYAVARRRSQLRGAVMLGSLCVIILALAATLFAYRNQGDEDVFDTPTPSLVPPGQVTTSSVPSGDNDDDQQGDDDPSDRPGTTVGSSTTLSPTQTTAPTRTTVPSTAVTTAPPTTAPPTTEPPTTEPPTTEPPTTEPPTTEPPVTIIFP
jgi:actin-like ATPase involved in cell morphogenesis